MFKKREIPSAAMEKTEKFFWLRWRKVGNFAEFELRRTFRKNWESEDEV